MGFDESTCDQIENLIKSGQIEAARSRLSSLEPGRIPRSLCLRAANLCRRSDLVPLALKILGPIVRFEKGRWKTNATPFEMAEYAVLVQKTGAVREAGWILRQVDTQLVPEALLYSAYCHMHLWEYDRAVRHLENYEHVERRAYQILVSRVNRAAALIALERADEARTLLDELVATTGGPAHLRLRANSYELRAQVEISCGNLAAARNDLKQAGDLLAENPASDFFYISKWKAVVDSLESKDTTAILRARDEALARRQYESVRTLDRFALKIAFDETRFRHLLYGTPHSNFRTRLLAEHRRQAPTENFINGSDEGPTLELETGQLRNGIGLEPPSRKVHQLFNILLNDFYHHPTGGALFNELFPGEFFDYSTSLHRVSQIIYRARKWISENQFPVSIEVHNGRHSLRVNGFFGFAVPYHRGEIDSQSLRLDQLQKAFGEREFKPTEGATVLGLSATSFRDLMRAAIENGLIDRKGTGPSTRYLFGNSRIKSAG